MQAPRVPHCGRDTLGKAIKRLFLQDNPTCLTIWGNPMSFEIPVSYVEQFSANVHMLAEQRMSRLENWVMREDVVGESFAKERVGNVEANLISNLHGDTPLNPTPHSRRWGFMKDYDVADLIDKESKLKLLIDPMGPYTMKHAGAMGRAKDLEIIRAAEGTAQEGKNGSTAAALPAAQQIAAGGTGLTTAKVRNAKKLLDQAEVDEFIPRVFVTNAEGMDDLLAETEVTSSDFNTVKALVRGEIDTWVGFRFIRTELLTTQSTGPTVKRNLAWAMQGITLGMGADIRSIGSPRPDKRHSQQIYTWMSIGAVRVEDVQVVAVDVQE